MFLYLLHKWGNIPDVVITAEDADEAKALAGIDETMKKEGLAE